MTAAPERVKAFRDRHRRGAGFILPNAWDGGSARMAVPWVMIEW